MAFTEQTRRVLTAKAVARQREGRVPGLAAGVARKGRLAWFAGIGSADLDWPDEAPDEDTQYAVASNTKTLTAVCVLALRDAGRLTLDDRVDRHLPTSTHGDVTVRQLLSHASGMQREPVGDVWETQRYPSRAELVASWDEAERVLRPHDRLHYSNLGYALLGEIVARLEGAEWYDVVRRRLLEPLEMRRTTLGPDGRRAGGYFVPPFSDVPRRELQPDCGAIAPAGGLWSTPADLARWGGFVADPVSEVLAPDTLEEMCQLQLLGETPAWTHGWGLGFHLVRREGRTWVGHTGGWPGSITGLYTHRESATSALVLMNSSVPVDPILASLELGTYAVEHEPVSDEPWRPGTSVPEELAGILGVWYSEGEPYVFSVRQGELEARSQAAPAAAPSSTFERVADDVWRTTAGRERGELLRVTRDDAGGVRAMHWATYLLSRAPLGFGERPGP